jgi:hypothetical protein
LLRSRARIVALVAAVACAVTTSADGPGRTFARIPSPFVQELYGQTAAPANLGGVAFAPDGDVWAAECRPAGTRLHRYDSVEVFSLANGTILHEETTVDLGAAGGCALVNHPDGYIYSASSNGIWRLDASTGVPAGGVVNTIAGSGIGLAVDPLPGNHLVYTGADCSATLTPGATACTLWDLDPATGATAVFARISRDASTTIDSLYFAPGGNVVFGAYASATAGAADPHGLVVITRPSSPRAATAAVDDGQVRQRVAMPVKPSGVAFNTTDGFVLTLDQSFDTTQCINFVGDIVPSDETTGRCPVASMPYYGGTLTRLDFPNGDYAATPAVNTWGYGGFRGGLLQVAPDGCAYLTHGPATATGFGLRYDDGRQVARDGVTRLCGGFAAFAAADGPQAAGRIGDLVWLDADGDGLRDPGEAGLDGVDIVLRDASGDVTATTTTANGGAYQFTNLLAGTYSVAVAAAPAGMEPTSAVVGGDRGLDSNASPASVTLSANDAEDLTIDFGYRPTGRIAGVAFADWNRNGARDASEPAVPGVAVSLTGSAVASATSGGDGSYAFGSLLAGTYQLTAPGTAFAPAGPLTITLTQGQRLTANLSLVESVAPVCTTALGTGTPTTATATVRDAGGGVRRIRVTHVSNYSVTIAPGGAGAATAPVTVDYPLPAASDIVVTATRVDAATAAALAIEVTDAFGNVTTCAVPAVGGTPATPPPTDPKPTDPKPAPSVEPIQRVVESLGRDRVVVIDRFPSTLPILRIENGTPGLKYLAVRVNHRWYQKTLSPGQKLKLDLTPNLRAGKRNEVVLVGWAPFQRRQKQAGKATVTFSDR